MLYEDKNGAPQMFENVLVFGGKTSPAHGDFRELYFASNHGDDVLVGEHPSNITLIGTLTRRQKYFSIRSEQAGLLTDSDRLSAPGAVSCRWPLAYHVKLFRWTGDFLLNGRGQTLGLQTSPQCGPGFDKLPADVDGDTART